MFRCLSALVFLVFPAAAALAGPVDDGRWYAGAYSFSDERGGFRIISVSGVGTSADPFVIVQELDSASPVTLAIHAVLPVNPTGKVGEWVTGMLHVQIVTVNGSGQPWIGFNFELQEVPGVPSTFGDGLSFDQREMDRDAVGADRFGSVERQFEPYDRLEYRDGHVDPRGEASFRFFISDFTPNERFYLVQDPTVPFS